MMSRFSAVLGTVLVSVSAIAVAGPPATGNPASAASDPGARADDVKAIRASLDDFAQAFRKADAKAIGALFAEEGEAVDGEGNSIQGRDALQSHYAARFNANPGETIETTVETIKFLAPGVARANGRIQITPSDGGSAVSGRFSSIHVKRDGHWFVGNVREHPDKELSHHERLKELEWLVGDWVEETENAVVLSSVSWVDNKTFLLRSFDVRVKGRPAFTGTQRIGWDPLTKQLKSWDFDSLGGYGDGLWMRAGNQWIIKAAGVRPDGRTATSTRILTYVNKDTFRWKSIDRTAGAEIADDVDEVTMVRQPPQSKQK
jgi:uncharacterized protein (TIGR02246 family)